MSYPWVILQLKKLLQEINIAIANHNVAGDSHPDLRNTIDGIIDKLDDHMVDPGAHQDIRDEIDTKIGDHDVDPNSHQDIRDLVGDGVDSHDVDPTAHQDIRDIIDGLEFIKDVSFDSTTGDLTFTYRDDSTLVVNVFADNLIEEITYDSNTNELVMTRHDGSESRLDISQFAGSYFGEQSEHIDVNVGSDKSIRADLRPGSITEKELDIQLVENLQSTFCIARYISENGRVGWLTTQALLSGSTMKLPMKYIPGKNMFLLFYKGVTCIPRGGPSLEPGTRYQYEEIVLPNKAMSDEIRIFFDVEADKTFDMWICGTTSDNTTGDDDVCPIERDCLAQDVQDSLDLADSSLQSLPPHTHDKTEIDNFDHTHTQSDITDWDHTHTIADITDLDCITNVTYDKDSCTLTFTKQDNSTFDIVLGDDDGSGGTGGGGTIKDITFDSTTNTLIITDADDTTKEVSLADLSDKTDIDSLKTLIEGKISKVSTKNIVYGTDHDGTQSVYPVGNFAFSYNVSVDPTIYNSFADYLAVRISKMNEQGITTCTLNVWFSSQPQWQDGPYSGLGTSYSIGIEKAAGSDYNIFLTESISSQRNTYLRRYRIGTGWTEFWIPFVDMPIVSNILVVGNGRIQLMFNKPVPANHAVVYYRYRKRSGNNKNGRKSKTKRAFRPYGQDLFFPVPINATSVQLPQRIGDLHARGYYICSANSNFNQNNKYIHTAGQIGLKEPSRANKLFWKFGLVNYTTPGYSEVIAHCPTAYGPLSAATLLVYEHFNISDMGIGRKWLAYKII